MTARPENWPERLHLFFAEKGPQPFDWRMNNCCFFACDWLAILTGDDPAAPYRARVCDALSAARAFSAEGGVEAIAERICAERGWPECPVALARRGDVVLVEGDGGAALGVCAGELSAFAGPKGITWCATLSCRRAWRIL